VLAQVWVVLEPAVPGFEAKNPPLLHDHEEHDQGLMLVENGRPRCERAASWCQKRSKSVAQFIILCSASNLAEARPISSPVQGSSPAKT
jgi:hypothetical protein